MCVSFELQNAALRVRNKFEEVFSTRAKPGYFCFTFSSCKAIDDELFTSGLRERVIWMIQTRGRPVTGSEIAEKFGVTLIEFNRVANGITRDSGQIAQIVESEKWLNEDGICRYRPR